MRREFKNISGSIRVLCTLTVKFTVNKLLNAKKPKNCLAVSKRVK